MEPVTHILTGACLARSGLNRKAAYTTAAMAVAAYFPDIDVLWGLRGPVEGFQHHRGITHTFVGIPFEAALLTALVYLFHRWRVHRAAATGRTRPLTLAPTNWPLLYGFLLLALLSHILLDWTNNYGVRPFFPFNPHWYAGSFVFIFDPWLFLVLLAAAALPSLFRLISREVGEREQHFRGRAFARAALVLIAAYYGLRFYEHAQAVHLALQASMEEPRLAQIAQGLSAPPDPNAPLPTPPPPLILTAQRVLASPDPLSPFRWYTVTDFGPLYRLGEADTAHSTASLADDNTWKADATDPALQAAFRSPIGRAYLDWSPMPFIEISRPNDKTFRTPTIVFFSDPRFMGDALLLRDAAHPPLSATVELNHNNEVTAQTVDGREEP